VQAGCSSPFRSSGQMQHGRMGEPTDVLTVSSVKLLPSREPGALGGSETMSVAPTGGEKGQHSPAASSFLGVLAGEASADSEAPVVEGGPETVVSVSATIADADPAALLAESSGVVATR
jgi:hypothetical protein